MISKEEFAKKFEKEFENEVATFKKNTKFCIAWVVIATIVTVGIVVGLHFLLDRENEHWILYVIGGIVGWFGLSVIPVLSAKDKLMHTYKSLSLGKLLNCIYGDKVFYSAKEFMPADLFAKSEFVKDKFDIYSGEDLFSFELKGRHRGEETTTAFFASDVCAKKTIELSDGKTDKKTLFDGTFCAIKFRRPFKCKLDLNSCKKSNLKPLETESHEFNKTFAAQTDDQIEARLILTLPLMDKLLQIAKNSKAKIGCSFRDNFLFIYINKNLFKFSSKDDKFDFKFVEPIYSDLKTFEDIASEIEGNHKIFRI